LARYTREVTAFSAPTRSADHAEAAVVEFVDDPLSLVFESA